METDDRDNMTDPLTGPSTDHAELSTREPRTDRSEARTEHSEAHITWSETYTERSEAHSEQSGARTERGEFGTEHGGLRTEHGESDIERGELRTERGGLRTERGEFGTEHGGLRTEHGESDTEHGELYTEQSDPRYRDIDRLPTEEIARLMNEADATVPGAVAKAIPAVSAAVDAIVGRMARGGRLFYVGAGTSGRLGVLDASECPPTFGTHPDLVQGVIAGGEAALTRSIEGAEDDHDGGAAAIADRGLGPLDSLVGISASGRAPFVLGALGEAARRGALTVSLSCNPGSPLSKRAEHPIEVVVGPEVVAGSTRLKAGTAQKLVLNMISTIAMIRLGKTYGNAMVEVAALNAKLARRATRIVGEITGAGPAAARDALAAADWNVKVAVLMIEHGLGADDARALLEANGDRLEAARRPGIARSG